MPLFCNWFGKRIFVFFLEVSKYYGLNSNFFESHSFKILTNNMNQKAGFEIILKRCDHVTYVTVRKIIMVVISMITNQNWVNKYLLHYSLFLKFFRDINILNGSLGVQNVLPFIKILLSWKKRTKDVKVYGYS